MWLCTAGMITSVRVHDHPDRLYSSQVHMGYCAHHDQVEAGTGVKFQKRAERKEGRGVCQVRDASQGCAIWTRHLCHLAKDRVNAIETWSRGESPCIEQCAAGASTACVCSRVASCAMVAGHTGGKG